MHEAESEERRNQDEETEEENNNTETEENENQQETEPEDESTNEEEENQEPVNEVVRRKAQRQGFLNEFFEKHDGDRNAGGNNNNDAREGPEEGNAQAQVWHQQLFPEFDEATLRVNETWGSELEEKPDGAIRVFFQNVNGITHSYKNNDR
jgi:hypothetical protein